MCTMRGVAVTDGAAVVAAAVVVAVADEPSSVEVVDGATEVDKAGVSGTAAAVAAVLDDSDIADDMKDLNGQTVERVEIEMCVL